MGRHSRTAGKVLLVGAGAAFLAWQVIKASSVNALVRGRPALAAMVDRDHPAVRLSLAMLEFRLRQGRVSAETKASAYAALKDDPLAEEPFILSAVDSLAAGEPERGKLLLLEAQRRDPRSRISRLLLLDLHLKEGRVRDATVEIGALSRLMPATTDFLIPELARLASNPRTQGALISALRADPPLLQGVLERLAVSNADPDLILRLSSAAGGVSAPGATAWQDRLIDNLVERGEVARAYRVWRSFNGIGGSQKSEAIHDPRFADAAARPPFNWKLVGGADGAAERSPDGLQVTYYGRAAVTLAEQLLMLPPGRHRFQFEAQGDAKGEGSKLAWSLVCHGSKAELGQVALEDVTSAGRAFAGEFVVPASGCNAQWLRLSGIPTGFPAEQTAVIPQVRMVRGGGS